MRFTTLILCLLRFQIQFVDAGGFSAHSGTELAKMAGNQIFDSKWKNTTLEDLTCHFYLILDQNIEKYIFPQKFSIF